MRIFYYDETHLGVTPKMFREVSSRRVAGWHAMMNDVHIRHWNAFPVTSDDKVCASRTQWNVFQLPRRRQTSHSFECKYSNKKIIPHGKWRKISFPVRNQQKKADQQNASRLSLRHVTTEILVKSTIRLWHLTLVLWHIKGCVPFRKLPQFLKGCVWARGERSLLRLFRVWAGSSFAQ